MEDWRLGESTEHVKCRSGARASGLTGNVRRDCLAFLRSQDYWVLFVMLLIHVVLVRLFLSL